MPIHKVQAPDGTIIKVEAPDGADPQAIIDFAKSNYKPKAVEKPVPEEVGTGQSLLIGAGRSGDKMVQGTRQLWNEFLSKYGSPETAQEASSALSAIKSQEAAKDEAFKGLQEQNPISTQVGGSLPFLAIPGSASIPVQALLAGAMGASKYGDATDRMKEGALEAAGTTVGAVAGKVINKLIDPVEKNVINSTRKSVMDAMVERGYSPRLSEVTGSPAAAAVERFSANRYGGRGVLRGQEAANESVINAIAANSIGQNADELSSRVLGAAKKDLGSVFDEISNIKNKTIAIGPQVGNAADEILREQSKLLPTQRNAELMKLANTARSLSSAKAKIDGEAYQLQRSALSDSVDASEGLLKNQYRKLLTALDDSAEQSLRSTGKDALADSLKDVRPKYANLKTLEKTGVVKGGDLRPQRLSGKNVRGDLELLRDFGESFDKLPKTIFSDDPVSLVTNAMISPLSYAGAKVTTSPALVSYARHIGGTPLAENAGVAANQSLRTIIDAVIQKRLEDLRTQGEQK